MRKSIVIQPIEKQQEKLPEIIYSDQGSQYRSIIFQELHKSKQTLHSISYPETPVDNAVIESYHKTIKLELKYPNKNKTKAEIRALIQEYLSHYYADKRINSKFILTPSRYEQTIQSVT